MAETKNLDAIALLKKDHDEVEDLFKQFSNASGEGRKEKLARQICQELTIHAQIEEEIFYPACEGKVDEDLLKRATASCWSAIPALVSPPDHATRSHGCGSLPPHPASSAR